MSDDLDLADEDDGQLFVCTWLNTSERRIARYASGWQARHQSI
jgi:hypothetical protein